MKPMISTVVAGCMIDTSAHLCFSVDSQSQGKAQRFVHHAGSVLGFLGLPNKSLDEPFNVAQLVID